MGGCEALVSSRGGSEEPGLEEEAVDIVHRLGLYCF